MSRLDFGGVEAEEGELPLWWIGCAAAAILVAAGYWYWHEGLGATPGPLESYLAERAAARDTGEEVTAGALRELSGDELTVEAGKNAFAAQCARCHGAEGEGKIGPNLTDRYWIAGGAPLDIYTAIVEGRPARGMPAWGRKLGPAVCKQITAFLLTIRDRDLPGKAPEGEVWEPPPPAED